MFFYRSKWKSWSENGASCPNSIASRSDSLAKAPRAVFKRTGSRPLKSNTKSRWWKLRDSLCLHLLVQIAVVALPQDTATVTAKAGVGYSLWYWVCLNYHCRSSFYLRHCLNFICFAIFPLFLNAAGVKSVQWQEG